MKYLLLIVIYFITSEVFSDSLSVDQVYSIESFTESAKKTRVSVDLCLIEVTKTKKQGLECHNYNLDRQIMDKRYLRVIKIDHKLLYNEVANNNEWYYSFSKLDLINFKSDRIKHILKKQGK